MNPRHLYKDNKGRFIASIRINGKQHLKRVKDKEQAHEWFLCMETGSLNAAQLTYKQLIDAANALTMLHKAGASLNLEQVVTEWLKGASSAVTGQGITFNEAIPLYLERSMSRVGKTTMRDYRIMLLKFKEAIGGEHMVGSFKKPDALKFLDQFLNKPPTWLAYKRTLSRFFTECVSMDWCQVNPFVSLDAPKCKPPERKFLSVNDTRLALQSVLKRKPRFIHFLTLGLFAGIRPIESLRLTARHFNLATGYIHLSADIVKSHSYKERTIPINDTLMAWLKAYPFEEKPIPVNDIGPIDKALKECAELDHWDRSPDCLRHSWCTYQFGLTQNSHQTAAWAGHEESICMKHYRGRVTKDEAVKFFDLMPEAVIA